MGLSSYRNIKTSKSQAFTIVEVLVIIAVIGILAAIVIISFNSATRSAEETSLKADLRTASSDLESYAFNNQYYPAQNKLSDAVSSGLGASLEYSPSDNRNSYCLTANSTSVDLLAFHVREDGIITDGPCGEHLVAADACFIFSSGTITGYYNNENNNSSNPDCPKGFSIPSKIGGVTVTRIESQAFNNKGLVYIGIPNSVTHISNNAFSNNQLASVKISNAVHTINMSAFQNNELTSLTIPDSVVAIAGSAFQGNQLRSVIIPSSVNNLQGNAFRNNNLTSISLPTGVSLGSNVFDAGVTINYY